MASNIRIESAEGCTGSAQPGTLRLLERVMSVFGSTESGGVYNCRSVRGRDNLSVHGEGRAFDVRPVGIGQGDAIARWLVGHAKEYQIQRVIWNRRIWEPGKPWRTYTGVNPHTDHLHVEQNWCGAAGKDCPPLMASSTVAAITLMAMVAAGGLFTLIKRRRRKRR